MPQIRCARCLPVIRRCCHIICLRVAFCHVIICTSSAFHLHVFQNLHPFWFRRFSLLSVLSTDTLAYAHRTSQTLFREREEKRSRNRPRFAEWPWHITGRASVKFRSIWRSFDAPTVNRVTAKSFCVLQQNPPLNSPKPL